jgi:hypothetical protein
MTVPVLSTTWPRVRTATARLLALPWSWMCSMISGSTSGTYALNSVPAQGSRAGWHVSTGVLVVMHRPVRQQADRDTAAHKAKGDAHLVQ